ncbi:dethiobiotin synthase [Fulvivirga sediminis]|uniref:ATP-dependent dethiobiotin synthetase BioD n=1 Tax=Fulvivirga sediminis TaxID=2803949 RepID=A0A937F8R8_9BACT|nr:dethiobiotin synthase [Fulvivirga sediminis]MBL3658562.1 dethiobiotin synthase [Fulvivirga sediminis]
MNYFISAIGTDSGKTLASAIITKALGADYWKPVQAGEPTDSSAIRQWIGDEQIIHPEAFYLKTPASPHYAAELENIELKIDQIQAPITKNHLVIEGAGGLMVPLNHSEFMIDLIPHFNAELILICNVYLGSINHTILSLEAVARRGYAIKGIIFNGPDIKSTKEIILNHCPAPCLLHIAEEEKIDIAVIEKYSEQLKNNWNELDRKR